MREILFRGKTEQGEWVYGFYAELKNIDQSVKPHILFYRHGEEYDRESYCAEVIPSTIGQYTGLTDKNGTKIFEGDILQFMNILRGERRLPVSWEAETTSWMCGVNYTVGYVAETSRVIGNIHEEVTNDER